MTTSNNTMTLDLWYERLNDVTAALQTLPFRGNLCDNGQIGSQCLPMRLPEPYMWVLWRDRACLREGLRGRVLARQVPGPNGPRVAWAADEYFTGLDPVDGFPAFGWYEGDLWRFRVWLEDLVLATRQNHAG